MMPSDDRLMSEIIEGIKAAGLEAIEQARRTHTKLVIYRNEKIVHISPDEALAILKQEELEHS